MASLIVLAVVGCADSPGRPRSVRPAPAARETGRVAGASEPIEPWLAAFEGTPHLASTALGPDHSVWVVGSFQSEISLGDNHERSGAPDHRMRIFVARFDPDGRLAWLVQGGGDHEGELGDIAVRRDGSAVVAGWFTGTLSWTGSQSSSPRAVIASLDRNGKLVWVDDRAGRARAVAAHPDDSVTAAGEGVDARRGFVVRYTRDGSIAWDNAIDSSGVRPASVAAAGDRAIAVGSFEREARFRGTGGTVEARTAVSAHSVRAANPSDAFVASYAADGRLEWSRHGGGTMFTEASDVVALADGAVAVTGSVSGDLELGKLRRTGARWVGAGQDLLLFRVGKTGDIDWVVVAPGAAGRSLTSTPRGDLIVGAGAAHGALFGDASQAFATQRMPYEPVLVRYRRNGKFEQVERFAPEHSGLIDALDADASGRIAAACSGHREVVGRSPKHVQMRSPDGVDMYAVASGFVSVAGAIDQFPRPSAAR